MNYIVTEPNFVGFLTAVYDSYYEKTDTQAITSDRNSLTLIDKFACSCEDTDKAKKVKNGIIKKGGKKYFDDISDAYRSGQANKEQIIYEYLKLFFTYGTEVEEHYDDMKVKNFNDILRKVRHEVHRLSAFIRLQETSGGVYYSYYSSDNDILEKITPILERRFNTLQFVVHDYKRRKMAFYDGTECHYRLAPEKVEIELSEKELFFQDIWKNYHETVAIKGRENPRLQANFLPKRYRYFMNEF